MSVQVVKLISPISKKDQVVAAIKEAIFSGRIEPGDPLVESRFAQQLGAGTPLVREALIELENVGFVQKIPYKGTFVTKLGPKEVEQIFNLRAELEALAMEWAKKNATPADIAELREMVEEMKQGAKKMDLDQFYEYDLAFHRKIWQLSDNPYLANALERAVIPLFAFFLMKTSRQRENYIQSAEAHGRLVKAFESSSAAGLRRMMKASVEWWKDEMLNRLFTEKS
ncbi:MAG: GntR family transcriptional regulator [Blastocatellia bacterium]